MTDPKRPSLQPERQILKQGGTTDVFRVQLNDPFGSYVILKRFRSCEVGMRSARMQEKIHELCPAQVPAVIYHGQSVVDFAPVYELIMEDCGNPTLFDFASTHKALNRKIRLKDLESIFLGLVEFKEKKIVHGTIRLDHLIYTGGCFKFVSWTHAEVYEKKPMEFDCFYDFKTTADVIFSLLSSMGSGVNLSIISEDNLSKLISERTDNVYQFMFILDSLLRNPQCLKGILINFAREEIEDMEDAQSVSSSGIFLKERFQGNLASLKEVMSKDSTFDATMTEESKQEGGKFERSQRDTWEETGELERALYDMMLTHREIGGSFRITADGETCSSCNHVFGFKSLVFLDCRHVFCSSCLNRFTNNIISREPRQFLCPLCNTKFDPLFTTNSPFMDFYISDIAQNIRMTIERSKSLECANQKCKNLITLDFEIESGQSLNLQCQICRKTTCSYCKKKGHVFSCDKLKNDLKLTKK